MADDLRARLHAAADDVRQHTPLPPASVIRTGRPRRRALGVAVAGLATAAAVAAGVVVVQTRTEPPPPPPPAAALTEVVRISDGTPAAFAVGSGALWVVHGHGVVDRVDTTTGDRRRIELLTRSSYSIEMAPDVVVGRGGVYVAWQPGGVWRIDPQTERAEQVTVAGGGTGELEDVTDLALIDGRLWLTTQRGQLYYLADQPGAAAVREHTFATHTSVPYGSVKGVLPLEGDVGALVGGTPPRIAQRTKDSMSGGTAWTRDILLTGSRSATLGSPGASDRAVVHWWSDAGTSTVFTSQAGSVRVEKGSVHDAVVVGDAIALIAAERLQIHRGDDVHTVALPGDVGNGWWRLAYAGDSLWLLQTQGSGTVLRAPLEPLLAEVGGAD